jgi:hypothetical protein
MGSIIKGGADLEPVNDGRTPALGMRKLSLPIGDAPKVQIPETSNIQKRQSVDSRA